MARRSKGIQKWLMLLFLMAMVISGCSAKTETAAQEEAIPSLDADHIIVFPSNGTWNSPENQEAIRLLDGKLWQTLPAVKNKHVYMMERSHWQSGAVIANSMKIDDLLEKMTP